MNYKRIDQYMEEHDFLQADKQKVYNYIEQHNRTFTKQYQFADGYLTRSDLILTANNGTTEEISRLQLGIAENFV